MVYLSFLLVVLHLQLTLANQVYDQHYQARRATVHGELGTLYNVTVNSSTVYDIEFTHQHTENSVVRLTTGFVGRTDEHANEFPLQIVVRQQLIVQSWNLPFQINKGIHFLSVSRMLCTAGVQVNLNISVDVQVTTFSESNIEMGILAELLHNLTVSVGGHYNIYVTPSSPVYYKYTFDNSNDKRPVTLYIKSTQNYYCSTVVIQAAECPVEDIQQIYTTNKVISQTFLMSAAVIINKLPGSKSVFIVFMVSPSDVSCAKADKINTIGDARLKHIEFWIEGHIADTVYIYAVLAALAYSMLFYLCTLFTYLFIHIWRKRNDRGVELEEQDEDVSIIDVQAAEADVSLIDVQAAPSSAPTNSFSADCTSDESVNLTDVDTLEDANEIKNVYRLKRNLMVSDMTRKDHSKLRKKFMLYFWNVIIISIFYGLPVIQLVLTYQQYLNSSGNQDTCYYNFQCARKLGVFYTFNNVISNISYVLLGMLFIVIVRYRHVQHNKLSETERTTLGIPQFFGLLYAMGWALTVEGIMSACYHVCPSSNNFQFDTSFMYILGGMLTLRLFQSRHPDINANAHSAFLMLALIILITVIGVLFNTPALWYVFFCFHLLVIFYMSLQIYYAGRFKLDRSLIQSLRLYVRSDCCKCVSPTFKARFGLLAVINLINLGVALYGLIAQPEDFATFMLAVIVSNLFCYFFFYIAMKLFHKEKILPPSIILGVLAMVLAGAALYLFTRYLTNWITTPALSRNQNKDCFILDFYDTHDVWHFLSAGGIFCVFLAVLFIDDDLQMVPRTEIPVF